jgi:hypothetical protein
MGCASDSGALDDPLPDHPDAARHARLKRLLQTAMHGESNTGSCDRVTRRFALMLTEIRPSRESDRQNA